MNGKLLRISVTAAALLASAVLVACGSRTPKARVAPISMGIQNRVSNSLPPLLHNTVGEFAAFIDGSPTPVEGWGVVASLPHTGSGTADPKIREDLINQLVIMGVGLYSTETNDISPEAILSSDQVSVVEVRGVIPPLARRNSTFDLYVSALPNSGTTSLANGLLWPSDLKRIGLTVSGNDTRTVAMGRGPVFIPASLSVAEKPSEEQAAASSRLLRSGRILAGGVCGEDSPARLQVYIPDFARTMMIERAINSKFPSRNKVAEAQDQSIINLHVPPEYYDNPMDFVELVNHIYLLGDDPGFNQEKAQQLIAALAEPDAPHRSLGLALQGIGRSILWDYLQPQYTSPNPQVRFWCARAGACMQDVAGLTALEEMVKDPANPMRRQALMAIIDASRGRDTTQATVALYEMLRSYNTDDRILAYHALLAIRSRAVSSYNVGKKFMLDVVPADSPPLIYVLQSESPRIALIGRPLELTPGALYLSADKNLTVVADQPGVRPSSVVTAASLGSGAPGSPAAPAASQPKEDETVTLYWRSPLGRTAEIRTVPRIPELIARATWVPDPDSRFQFSADTSRPYVGASYQRIAEMLATMCAEKTLNATFVTQKAAEVLLSPADLALQSRPEGSTLTVPQNAQQPEPLQPLPQQQPFPLPGAQPATLPPGGSR